MTRRRTLNEDGPNEAGIYQTVLECGHEVGSATDRERFARTRDCFRCTEGEPPTEDSRIVERRSEGRA